MSTLESIAPQFVVPDVVKTAEYYRDQLGFTIQGYWMDPPIYAIVERDGVRIHFGKGDTPVASGNVVRRKGGLDAYLYVTGVDELFKEFRERNVKLLTKDGPCDAEYKQREVLIEDLNGFVLAFGEAID